MIELTARAVEILSKAEAAARRFDPGARVRLVRDAAAGVRFELTEDPAPTDTAIGGEGFTLFVQAGLDGVVDVVEPHDQLILRAPGSTDRSVR